MAAGQLQLGTVTRRPFAGAALTLALSAVLGCATAADAPLRGTTWAAPAGATGTTGAGTPPHLKLETQELRLSGFAGCNRINGSFAIDGSRISFGTVVSTRRACYPDDGSEQRFLQALSEVRGWRMEGGQLLLLADGGKPLLRFSAAPDKP